MLSRKEIVEGKVNYYVIKEFEVFGPINPGEEIRKEWVSPHTPIEAAGNHTFHLSFEDEGRRIIKELEKEVTLVVA